MWFLGKRETVNAWKKADFDGFRERPYLRGKQTQILGGQQRGNGSAKMISMARQFIIINPVA